MKIKLAKVKNAGVREELIELIAKFKVDVAKFKGKNRDLDLKAAEKELNYYLERDYPIYIAQVETNIVGYIVCKIEEEVVWAESIFVLPEYRNQGIGSKLYRKAEEMAEDMGCETVYNWVHPNNHKVINFLQKQGYDVLNLIELRQKRSGEETTQKVEVGEYEFNY